ncbi:uncharacterized protein LOC121762234 [Salvia splendens]|uniref:uncharacterized protein LOC121762234 n=1 Tax=Salvia splendens TaxID=180675 RepID=UPI001C26F740|nr:uncharacterized protein LOC121762234 [Salvia splendens]
MLIALIAVSSGLVALVLFITVGACVRLHRSTSDDEAERGPNLQNGITRLHQVSPHHDASAPAEASRKSNYYLFRRGAPPPFIWADHPALVTDAVESGWPRFAFAAAATTAVQSSPSVKSLLGACAAAADGGEDRGVEIGWEVCEGSADFMQKIRLNPSAVEVVRAGLPLPGPNLGNSSFPQEAYFEVTVVACGDGGSEGRRERRGRSEGDDRIKLIDEDFNAKNGGDSCLVCVGLTGVNPIPVRFPGSFPASIGFNSTGAIFLNGTKLVPESEPASWGKTDKVVGCGYNPGQRKVFFTVDSKVVHEIHCKSEDYSTPLYPTLAASGDVVVLVNLGQSPFRFAPANQHRTPNPCFMGASPALGYEDSKELFSMGRIDSLWMQRSAARSNNNTVNSIKAMEEYDQESEGDLFEIVLESSGRSPYTGYTTPNIH